MITLSMIVKNEEKYLRDCLASVKEVADEIVIVDTGSTDKTISIAEEFGAKIYHFNWINDFAAARNFALEKSTGDWILYLDADERLLPKSVKEIKKLTENNSNDAYYCRINNIDSINNRPSLMLYARLFPNDPEIRFEGAIHEQIEESLRRKGCRINHSRIEIDHIGYNITGEGLKVKAERNLQVLLEEYVRKQTPYLAFHLGQTYGVLNQKDHAIKYFHEALKSGELKKEYRALAYRYIGLCMAEKQNWDSATEYVSNSIKCDPDQPLNLLAASEVYLTTGKYSEAADACYQAYKVNRLFSDGDKSSFQCICLDEASIIYQGLKIAITSGDAELFNIFFPLLKNGRNKSANVPIDELLMYDELLNNKEIAPGKIDGYMEYIDDKNLDLVLTMSERYGNEEVRVLLLKALAGKFPSNAVVLNKLGATLMKMKRHAEAGPVLEKAYRLNEDYPSTLFYLVSSYVQNNRFEKVTELIKSAEIKHASSPEILSRLNILKEKLNLV